MPFTQAQLEASLVALNTSINTIISSGFIVSYTLPTGVSVNDGFTVKQMMELMDYYRSLLRAYYPTLALSRGY